MAKMIFVNLPVTDVARSTAFYEALGFTRDPRFSNAQASALQWSDTIVLMVLRRDFFAGFVPYKPVADPAAGCDSILCLGLDSRAEVDAITEAAAAAGARTDMTPADDHGFMYGRSFEDPDGHVFAPMWMDVDAYMAATGGGAAGATHAEAMGQ